MTEFCPARRQAVIPTGDTEATLTGPGTSKINLILKRERGGAGEDYSDQYFYTLSVQ